MNGKFTNSGYQVEVDTVNHQQWSDLLMLFDDTTLHQVWAPTQKQNTAMNSISHLILKKDGDVAGICQISIKKIPGIKIGFANVDWGPLWRKKGKEANFDIFYNIIEALKNEYAINRRLLLRIWPNIIETPEKTVNLFLKNTGFMQSTVSRRYRTLLLNLSPAIDELRKNLNQKWRNQLNRAEKNDLEIIEGCSDDLFEVFLNLQEEMLTRKKFIPAVNPKKLWKYQDELPATHKMRAFVCKFEGVPVSAAILSSIGSTGIYLLGATGDKGMKLNGSNLIQWHMIKFLKDNGCLWYDLGGIDPVSNPGVYRFKLGIAGKTGQDIEFIGQFGYYNNSMAKFINILFNSTAISALKIRLRSFFK